MRAIVSILILLCGLAMGPNSVGTESVPDLGSPSPLLVSCVHRGYVYGVTTKKPEGYRHPQDILQRQRYSTIRKALARDESHIPDNGADSSFHIWDDSFFGTNVGIWHHSCLRVVRLTKLEADPEPGENSREKVWNALSLCPLRGETIRNAKSFGFSMDTSPTSDARQAFTIDADGKLNLFLAWRGRLRLWTGKLPKVADAFKLHHPPIKWDNWMGEETSLPNPTPVFRIETDIRERFYAYQDKSDYFFVTESGQVHALPRKGKLPERPEVIWQDKKRPVRLLIEDTATGTTWAFAPRKDAKDKDSADVFFPLARKIVPVEYKASDVAAIDRLKPLVTAVAHARFLDKHKKLGKPADAPKK